VSLDQARKIIDTYTRCLATCQTCNNTGEVKYLQIGANNTECAVCGTRKSEARVGTEAIASGIASSANSSIIVVLAQTEESSQIAVLTTQAAGLSCGLQSVSQECERISASRSVVAADEPFKVLEAWFAVCAGALVSH